MTTRENKLLDVLKELRKDKDPSNDNMMKQILIILELSMPKAPKKPDYTPQVRETMNTIQHVRVSKGLGRRRMVKRLIK
jgi:hypothetical protein